MAPEFLNYPTPTAHEVPYKPPPESKNPVFRGPLLHYGASIVASAPLLPYLLWTNAGFNSLRNVKELKDVEARFDPTVTPVRKPEQSGADAKTATLPVEKLRVPPKDANGRFYTIADFHEAYKSGRLTPTDVVESLLPLIRRDVAQRSPYSTAFVDTKVELVRKAAKNSTARWKAGESLGLLDGVPFTVKDDLDVKGYKRYIGTTHDYTKGEEVETSWCVQMAEKQGAVMVGKASMHELGLDTTNNNPNWGTPLNPYNNSYYTGGSSGGAACAVASGLVPLAIGSDGGGSIRIPSNYCGLYGLKPSHGRVSTAPMKTATSVTVRGPLASNMADLQVFYHAIAQPDPSDARSSLFPPPSPLTSTPPSKSSADKKLLGICNPWLDRADPPVQQAFHAFLHHLTTTQNYHVIDISIPLLHASQLAHAMTILSETAVSTSHHHNPNNLSSHSTKNLNPANKVLLSLAHQTPATDLLLAQRLRNLLMQHLAHLFTTHPGLLILTPTCPNVGWPIVPGDLEYGVSDGNRQIRNMEYVWLANFSGVPCLQVPVGYVEPEEGGKEGGAKLPVGVCAHAEWGGEEQLLEFGFLGEEWLNGGREDGGRGGGGRRRPEGWVDVLG